MKVFLIVAFLLSSLYAGDIEWQKTYDDALNKAKEQNKLLFVFITSTDCKFCKKLKETTLKDDVIVNNINKDYASVIVFKDDGSYPAKLEAQATPMLYFLDKDENIIDYSLGYWNAFDFKFILKDVKKRLNKKDKK
jgi:thioredoxin-related protein